MFVAEDDPGLLRAITDLLAGRGYMLNAPSKVAICFVRFQDFPSYFQLIKPTNSSPVRAGEFPPDFSDFICCRPLVFPVYAGALS